MYSSFQNLFIFNFKLKPTQFNPHLGITGTVKKKKNFKRNTTNLTRGSMPKS